MQKIKRPKLKARRRRDDTKPDKYKIWCTQVREEALTEDLVSCGVTKKMYQGRNVENYDLPSHFHLNGFDRPNNNSTDDEREEEEEEVVKRTSNKRTQADRKNVKLRLGKRHNSMEVDSQKGSVRTILELSTTIESTDSDVINDIVKKLNEKKDTLISKLISY